MKIGKLKAGFAGAFAVAALITASIGCGLLNESSAYADAAGAGYGYSESYRNQISYSAEKGWNNDPNGLLYANGVYHMYYQYNYDQRNGQTYNGWGNMSWGHATSTDLVHWEEQPVAIPAYQHGDDGKYYGMMFSGSAVYDENNTSGLFETEGGALKEGHGIVAVLTQPNAEAGGQRQILAYSTDNGQSFNIHGEILGAHAEGDKGDGEFRDPKVFWNAKLGKWLMAVGGGSVRMYSSENLLDWEYLGETGFWGECPDLSRFEVNGEEKYVLVISPEDKLNSHLYNKTDRKDTYYPAEYYVVGELDEDGLFYSREPLKRLSEGIDSYAFQSFNDAPDGKVYGVSWSASWKSVGEYEKYRENYNGGMTIVCELGLEERDGEYLLTRNPVSGFEELRGDKIKEYSDRLPAGKNALAGVRADVADIELSLDFTGSEATYAQLNVRVSEAEKITVKYDLTAQTLTLDRSGALLAGNTYLYAAPFTKEVALDNNVLKLRVLLDRAFVNVFAQDGEASYFAAAFPSAISNGMQLISDGEMGVNCNIYALESIFGEVKSADKLVVTTDKIDATAGTTSAIIASSYAENFNADEVSFSVTAGGENISLIKSGATAYVKALKAGSATVSVSYRGQTKDIPVFINENGLNSNVNYLYAQGGYTYITGEGLVFDCNGGDGFRFGDKSAENFIYTATFKGSQAGGLMFGISDNLYNYWVATVDLVDNKVKLWKSGVGDLKTADYNFNAGEPVKVTLAVSGGTAKIYINGDKTAAVTHKLQAYSGGKVGLNVYNAHMIINDISLTDTDTGAFATDEIIKVVNVTDGSYRLKEGDYTYENGRLTISDGYLCTLEEGEEYAFKVVTALTEFEIRVKADFASAAVTPAKNAYIRGDNLTLSVSEGVEVYKVEINGKPYEFTREGDTLTVSAEAVGHLTGGEHTVKVYTAKGRPTAQITVISPSDFRDDDTEAISHTFLYVDIAIFGALIASYVIVSVILKRKAKK